MAENINMQAKRTNEMETYDFIEGKDKFEDAWKRPGIPAVAPTSDYLGKYLLFGPSKPIGFEKESNQAVRLFYLSRQLVHDANLPITQQEIQDEAVKTLRSYGHQKIDTIPKEVFALALSKVILAKAQNHVLQNT